MFKKKPKAMPAGAIVDISEEQDWEKTGERTVHVEQQAIQPGSNEAATITAVEADPKKPYMYRLAIQADDSEQTSMLTVHEDTLVSLRLLKGRRLSPEEWATLRKEEEKEEAYRSALAILEFKARTEKELQRAMKRKGFSVEAITGCLERLAKQRLIDDSAYAKRYAEQRVVGQKKGRRLIRQELMQRGVGKQDVEDAISELDPETERESAMLLARKRWPSIKGKTERDRQMKLLGILLRRGFPNQAAWAAIRQLSSEADMDGQDWEEVDDGSSEEAYMDE